MLQFKIKQPFTYTYFTALTLHRRKKKINATAQVLSISKDQIGGLFKPLSTCKSSSCSDIKICYIYVAYNNMIAIIKIYS